MMRHWRFWFGRHLVHLGLFIMPRGRCQAELWGLFETWSHDVSYQVYKHGRESV